MVSLTPERLEAEAKDLEVGSVPWLRVVIGFCCASAVVMILLLCLGGKENLETMQPIAAETIVEPVFVFGEQVFFTRGFYRDAKGKVVGWDEPSCTYTIATDHVIVDHVPEGHLNALRSAEIDDPFGHEPLPAPPPEI